MEGQSTKPDQYWVGIQHVSKQLMLSELLTPPEVMECGTNHRPSEVGMQGSHPGESGRAGYMGLQHQEVRSSPGCGVPVPSCR